MKCKECNISMSISRAENVIKDDKLYKKFTFKCRNPNCVSVNKEITDYVEMEVTVE